MSVVGRRQFTSLLFTAAGSISQPGANNCLLRQRPGLIGDHNVTREVMGGLAPSACSALSFLHKLRRLDVCCAHGRNVPSSGSARHFSSTLGDMLVAVSVLAISLSILIYHYPVSTWHTLLAPAPPGGGERISHTDPQNDSQAQTPKTQNEHLSSELQSQPELPTKSPAKSADSLEGPEQTTPKAAPQSSTNAPAVPTFTLDAHDSDSDSEDEVDNLPPPSFPALNSAQRASAPAPKLGMPPPSKPTLMAPPSKPATTSLMPPPRVAPSNLRALPNTTQQMRVPSTGPLPNRGPVPNRGPPGSSGSLGLPPSAGGVKTPNARGKVLLSPGHSPLDWANLQKSGKNLSGVTSLVRVTPAMLKEKNGRKGRDAWSIYQGKVYNISPYLPFHPGGEGELRRAAGKDGTKLFMEVHPWVNWENMLGECLVGIMVADEAVGSLEDMD